jgi:hypothetical protein
MVLLLLVLGLLGSLQLRLIILELVMAALFL